jgi:1-acyl-sn-glycerol-3-phosphate acyltransferase
MTDTTPVELRPLPRWSVATFYWASTRLMALVLRVFGRWEVRGREHVPSSGPLLVVSNHLHNADPPLLGASITRRRIHFMAKIELFQKGVLGLPPRLFDSIPVRRDAADLRAIRLAQTLLRSGEAVGLLPEGHRNRHGVGMQPGHPGAALIALRSGALILPVGITGTEQIRGIGILLKRPRITVTIGEPFSLRRAGKVDGAAVREGTEIIMRRIAALLPPEYRGEWGSAGVPTMPRLPGSDDGNPEEMR